MIKNFILLFIAVSLWITACSQTEQDDYENFHQNINVDIDVSTSILSVTDTLYVPYNYMDFNKDLIFKLNKNLNPKSLSLQFSIKELKANKVDVNILTKTYAIKLNKEIVGGNAIIPIKYSGKIKDEIKEGAAEYARGFSETKGTITETGVYLAGSIYWFPSFELDVLTSFNLTVQIDSAWNVVSQGERTINKIEKGKRISKYHSPEPMDEVYLIAAKWTEYSMPAGKVLVQAFLRTPDKKLAYKYLGITSSYIKLYNDLIGDYPYTKFALVENFWETGYGMPSFTLLGEKVIRMPWILFSSYPHELLHNYWGNSVFVDYNGGNWCEGITAYMADHLLKEQRGGGTAYRRTTLQKFTDYVNEENDFPVNKFINRNNSAEEAIGYGKVLMINNMLRWKFGDKKFIEAYAKFYNDYKFKKATFTDIRKSFEAVNNTDLSAFFKQWIDRKGAPEIELSDVKVKKKKKQYHLNFKLRQTQKENVFNIEIPVFVYFEDKIVEERMKMNKKELVLSLSYDKKPLRVDIDPQFQIMRKLDRKEVPASLTQVFGEKEAIIILPETSKHLNAYTALAEMWKKTQEAQGKKLTIIQDNKIREIPTDKAVWILGFENKYSGFTNFIKKYNSSLGAKRIEQINKLKEEGSVVFAVQNSNNYKQTVGFVGANNTDAIKALSRKLLHYGKYGYLGFEGKEAKNVLKGSLPALNSPMNFIIDKKTEIKAKIIPRKALSETK